MYKLIESGTFLFWYNSSQLTVSLMPSFQFYYHSKWHSLQQAFILFSIKTHICTQFCFRFEFAHCGAYFNQTTDHLHAIHCVKPLIWIQNVLNYIHWKFAVASSYCLSVNIIKFIWIVRQCQKKLKSEILANFRIIFLHFFCLSFFPSLKMNKQTKNRSLAHRRDRTITLFQKDLTHIVKINYMARAIYFSFSFIRHHAIPHRV